MIGNANSSNDIAAHAAPIAQTPVYRSIRRPALFNFPSLPDPRIKDVAPVREYELVEAEGGAKKVSSRQRSFNSLAILGLTCVIMATWEAMFS